MLGSASSRRRWRRSGVGLALRRRGRRFATGGGADFGTAALASVLASMLASVIASVLARPPGIGVGARVDIAALERSGADVGAEWS